MTEQGASMEDRARDRRRRAIDAACAVAQELGITGSNPSILKDSNNTIVHFPRAAIIAKVGTSSISQRTVERLERELTIGLHLADRQAPIAPPASSVQPEPHWHGPTPLTLWEFRDHDPSGSVAPRVLATTLRELHYAFSDYPQEELPRFTDHLEEAGNVLSEPSRTPGLDSDDREFLRVMQRKALDSLRDFDLSTQPLHGEPHLDGNCLFTEEGPVFIDFEASCTGPKEWDLTSLPKEVASFYGFVDYELLDSLSLVRSLCVAAWCWMQPERAPEVAEAAHFHLSRLRNAVGGTREF